MTAEASPKHFLLMAAASCLVVLAFAWTLTAWLPMGFMPGEYAMWHSRERMIDRCSFNPTVILGDSRAAAGFVPAHIDGSTNLALGGSTPVEMFYQSQRILQCPVAPQRVVFSMSPELFAHSGRFWDRSASYGAFSLGQLNELRVRSRALHDVSIYDAPKLGDGEAILDNVLRALRFPSYYTDYVVSHLVVGRLKANRAVEEETTAAGGQHGYGTADGSSDVALDVQLKSFSPSPLFDEYFERMLNAYAERHVMVYFVGVPMNEATYQQMTPGVLSAFDQYLQGLAAKHPNFALVGDPVPPLPNRLFGDSTHLNQHGAELVSDHINQVLRGLPGPLTVAESHGGEQFVSLARSYPRGADLRQQGTRQQGTRQALPRMRSASEPHSKSGD